MLDVLTLDQLRVFVTVAESGSFRAGAARLSRVQSAVSHAIANLEAELGLTLFDRTGHRPVLTAEGQALLSNARDILLRIDALKARARGLGEGVELELSLTVDTLFPIDAVGRPWRRCVPHIRRSPSVWPSSRLADR
ncbi:LysR family transcriptional regulator (plasmid) [Tistrella mobilis KA081020-065]|uniref:LysR family transcriptional regulator n=1 Tax=Tistrella mobilis (strain KA081020-065) TaxID=1110502 RepID=I3TUU1_TISMK|nr:LysR family transcriptional regulator [Tistrella mobilis KA081020-065]